MSTEYEKIEKDSSPDMKYSTGETRVENSTNLFDRLMTNAEESVVEHKSNQPNKYISVESGVKLLNGDRVLQSGAPLKGGRERFSMADYSVLGDPLA